EAHVALLRVGLARLHRQEALGRIRVVVAHPRALVDLGLTLRDRLAHLERHRAGELGPAAPERLSRLAHPFGPRLEGHGAPLEVRRVARRNDTVELTARGRGERLEDFAGRGIDRLQAHGTLLLSMLSPESRARNVTGGRRDEAWIKDVGGRGSRRRPGADGASRAWRLPRRGDRPVCAGA